MKVSTNTMTWLVLAFIWSIFMGVTAGSIGVGAIYPPMNYIAQPFVCPNGKMEFQQNISNPLPGTTYIQAGWSCTDTQTGVTTELDIFPMSLYAGFFYGLVIFVVVCVIWYISKQRAAASSLARDRATSERANTFRDSSFDWNDDSASAKNKAEQARDAVRRMKELKEMRDAQLISDSEYEQKRAEILKDL